MTPYLQRLYDAAVGTAPTLEARPAQRSSSPLLAVDQRLASPAYVASFLLGVPGPGDPDADGMPRPEPDLLTAPAPGPRSPSPVPRAEEPLRVPEPRHLPSPSPQSETLGPVAPRPVPSAPQEPAVRPLGGLHADLAAPSPAAHVTPPPAESAPVPVEVPVPVATSVPRADPAPAHASATRPQDQVAAPVRPRHHGRLRAVTGRPARREPEKEAHGDPAAPTLLHPTPAAAAERLPLPLPMPPPSTPVEAADLADRVRRLVREALATDAAPRPATREQHDGVVATPVTTPSSARTAEAVSVIGPLDRPVRATTLYGLRLR